MAGLTLTTSRPVTDEEVEDLVGLVDFGYSPWFHDITDSIPGTVPLHREVHHDTKDDDEGAGSGHTNLTSDQILRAVEKALGTGTLCCSEALREELGMGCAQDADIIFQIAVYGDTIFG